MNAPFDWFNRYITPIATIVAIAAVCGPVSNYLSSALNASVFALLMLCGSLVWFRKGWTRSIYRIVIASPTSGSRVNQAKVQVQGRFAFKTGLAIGLFHKRNTKYYPQAPIKFNTVRGEWDGTVVVDGAPNARYDIVIASYSPQLKIAFDHYGAVGHSRGVWEAVEIPDNCSGFCILDHVFVYFGNTASAAPAVASIKSIN